MIDRIIAERHRRGERQLLVKWRGLEYGRATWEAEEDLADDADAIERYGQKNCIQDSARLEIELTEQRQVLVINPTRLLMARTLELEFAAPMIAQRQL